MRHGNGKKKQLRTSSKQGENRFKKKNNVQHFVTVSGEQILFLKPNIIQMLPQPIKLIFERYPTPNICFPLSIINTNQYYLEKLKIFRLNKNNK